MAAKRVDPLKAKEAKQKKIAIGGAVLLVALLAFQGPKTLKMLQGPQPVTPSAAASATTTPGTPAPVTGGTAAGTVPATGGTAAGAAPAVPAAELASVRDSDPAPEAERGQLLTFERFASKDPFAQQAQPVEKPAAAPAEKPAETDPAKSAESAEGSSPAEGEPEGGFTTGGSTPAAPELAAATSISVNGLAENVKLEATFPTAEPTFGLVSVAKDGKSVEIGIVGGSYESGGETLKLGLGKKITLQNTAGGSRYELELLAIQGFPLPKKG